MGVSDLTGTTTTQLDGVGNGIIQVLLAVGSIASVIMLVILGIKYMTGSVEEKAEYKRKMLPYVIGAILVFAASSIAGIVYSIFK